MRQLSVLIFATLVLLVAASAASAERGRFAARDRITVRSTEVLKGDDVTDGGVAARGRFTITGAITDEGSVTDFRTAKGGTVLIRRVAVGARGAITFLITIHLGESGAAPWKIISATHDYKGLHGNGRQVVDKYYETPAIFVLFSAIMVANAIYRQPRVSGLGILLIAAGIPVYLWFTKRAKAGP